MTNMVAKGQTKVVNLFNNMTNRVTNVREDVRERGIKAVVKEGFATYVNVLIIFAFSLAIAVAVLLPLWRSVAGGEQSVNSQIGNRFEQLIDEPGAAVEGDSVND